ncbi:MAG: hypothetical protein QXX13_03855 [Candidatus Methanomethylicia archaeon]
MTIGRWVSKFREYKCELIRNSWRAIAIDEAGARLIIELLGLC